MASLLIRSIRYLVTCDDKDQLLEDVDLYCEQNLTELHRRQNVEGAANRELLLILCAQMEAIIDHSTWADKDDITIAQAYYRALEDLGYPISDEETKALEGEYLPAEDEEAE